MSDYSVMESLQADVFAVLQNTPDLADANIILDAAGDVDSQVERALGTTKQRAGGKRGLAVIILLPEASASDINLPGPPLTFTLEVQTLEHAQINRGPSGTGIRSSAAALAVLHALHHHVTGEGFIHSAPDAIQPLPAAAGLVSHVVTLICRYRSPEGPGKVAAVTVTEADDTITLATATESAAIYYTTDGTYPTPTNGTLYTTPVVGPTIGDIWRVAAYKTGLNPSDILQFTIAVPENTLTDGGVILTDIDGIVLTDN